MTTKANPDAAMREKTAEGLRILARIIAAAYKRRLRQAEVLGHQVAIRSDEEQDSLLRTEK